MTRLVRDDAGHVLAAVHVHLVGELGVDEARGVPHVVAAQMTRVVAEPVRVRRRRREQQQARGLDGVAGHGHDARALPAHRAGALEVLHAVGAAVGAEGDPHGVGLRPQLEPAGRDGLGDLAHERRPLGAPAVALGVEAVLDGAWPPVVGVHVGGVRAGGVVAVADPLGPVGEHPVVRVGRHGGTAAAV